MTSFKDYFSESAGEYASYRPKYPDELAAFLASISGEGASAWEAGCGSGQLTHLLARHFTRVVATDPSADQLRHAPKLHNVEYRCVRAEESGLPARSADLCVAAQSAHWFDLEAYYGEVRRVGRSGAIVALITYALMRVDAELDELVRRFHETDLDPYWPPERRHVESGYATMPFPFGEMEAPEITMEARWTLPQLLGYMETWSGVRALIAKDGPARFDELAGRMARKWGPPSRRRPVRWPLAMRVGRL